MPQVLFGLYRRLIGLLGAGLRAIGPNRSAGSEAAMATWNAS
jgi:hypothetical protein